MKKRLMAIILSITVMFTSMPISVMADNSSESDLAVQKNVNMNEAEEIFEGDNIALNAVASASYTNPYTDGIVNINDGQLATDNTTAWNCWGNKENFYPVEVNLTWDVMREIEGMKVMWFADVSIRESNTAVSFPKSAQVQYMNENGEWIPITGMINEFGEITDTVGVLNNETVEGDGGIFGRNTYWNIVVFPDTIKTTEIRMLIERSGTDYNAVGISEWEVYGAETGAAEGDKTALIELIEMEAEEERIEADYSEDSWIVYTEALDFAQILVTNEGVTQEEIDLAVEMLMNAKNALVKVKYCTRSELAMILWEAFGSPEPEYTDHTYLELTSDMPYFKAAVWCGKNHFLTGKENGTRFAPDATIYRAELMAILERIAVSDLVEDSAISIDFYIDLPFEDVTEADWWYQSLYYAYVRGLIDDATIFNPSNTCTYEEVEILLGRLIGTVPLSHKILLNNNDINLNKSDAQTISTYVISENRENQVILWTSDDTSIASVNQDGLVTGVSAGTTQITATVEELNISATCTVNVSDSTGGKVVLDKGTTGNNLTWILYEDGSLYIEGEGDLPCEAPWSSYSDLITSVTIEEGIRFIEEYVFSDYSNLEYLNLPKSLEVIEREAFSNCSNLSEVLIASTFLDIGCQAFYSCTALSSIVFPENMECLSVQDEAFGKCFSLKKLTIPYVEKNEVSLGVAAFGECEALTEVIIKPRCIMLWDHTFYNCRNLKTVEFSESVEAVLNSRASFEGCEDLESITFMGDAPNLDSGSSNYIFSGLTTICYYPSNNESWTDEVMRDYGGMITWIAMGEGQKPEEVDKTVLQEVVDMAKEAGISADDYTEESWSVYEEALVLAEQILADDDVTQEEIDMAIETLINAKETLKEKSEVISPIIIVQPSDCSSDLNADAIFTVEAEGEGLTYQWQYSTSNGKYWTNSGMDGADTNVITVEATAKRDGQMYRCVITDTNGIEIISDPAILRIKSDGAVLLDFSFDDIETGFKGGMAVAEPAGEIVEVDGRTALYLNGTDTDWLNVTKVDGSSLLAGVENMTISFDVKSYNNNPTWMWAFYISPNENVQMYMQEKYIGPVVLNKVFEVSRYYSNNEIRPILERTEIPTDDWVHIEIILDSDTTIYKIDDRDYIEQTGMKVLSDILGEAPILYIGKANWENGEYFQGYLDNFKIVTGSEIKNEKPVIEIISQPQNQNTAEGTDAVFTIDAEGEGLSYQWQYSTSNGKYWVNSGMDGADTNAITVKAIAKRDGQMYRCVISDANGTEIISDPAILTIKSEEFVLVDFSFDDIETGFEGGIAVAKPAGDIVEVDGRTALYLNGTANSWLNVTKEDGSSLLAGVEEMVISFDIKTKGSHWPLFISPNANQQIYRNEKYISIMIIDGNFVPERYYSNGQDRPVFKTVPFTASEWNHIEITLTETATTIKINDGESVEQDNLASLAAILGDSPILYIGKANWADGEYFQGYLDNFKIVTSSEIENEKTVLKIISQPQNQNTTEGTDAVFTVEAEGEGLTYQWQFSKTSGKYWMTSSMEGADTNKLTVPASASRNGQMYRCIVTDKNGVKVTSDAVTLTVENKEIALVIKKHPENCIAKVGMDAIFTVEADGDELNYKWQYSSDGGRYWYTSSMAGADTNTLMVGAIAKRDGQMYRCVITDGNGKKVTSEVAVLTIGETGPVITVELEDQTVELNANAVFSVKAEGDGLTYQWQYRSSNSEYWFNSGMEGADTDTLTVQALAKRDGQEYRCVITDADGNRVISNTAVLKIK